jgi:hypothetical protein
MSVRDEAQGARSAGTEAYIENMSRLRAPRNAAIRPHRHLISASLPQSVNPFHLPFQNFKSLMRLVTEMY